MAHELDALQLSCNQSPARGLPRCSGVYRFYGKDGELLYVGKSVDIHARVLSHIQEGRKPGRHQRLMREVSAIDAAPTAGETGALLIENAAIKSETPLFNRRQRQARKLWTIRLQRDATGFLQPEPADFSASGERPYDCYGLFNNPRHIESSLRRHARDHGLCLRVMGMDRGRGPCFQFQIKRCDGACAGLESPEAHNARLLSILDHERIAAWPFNNALALREHNLQPQPAQPETQYHLVNHWAWQGAYLSFDALRGALQKASPFDRDAYRLILNALRRGRLEVLDALTGEPVDNPFLGLRR